MMPRPRQGSCAPSMTRGDSQGPKRGGGYAKNAQGPTSSPGDHSLPPLPRSGSSVQETEERRPEERRRSASRGPADRPARQQGAPAAEPPWATEETAGGGYGGGSRRGQADAQEPQRPQRLLRQRSSSRTRLDAAPPQEPEVTDSPSTNSRRPPQASRMAESRAPDGHHADSPAQRGERQQKQKSTSRPVAKREERPPEQQPQAAPMAQAPAAGARSKPPRGDGYSRQQQQQQRAAPEPVDSQPRAQSPPIRVGQQPQPGSPAVQKSGALSPAALAERAVELEAQEDTDLVPCKHCGRSFGPAAHAKHVGICQKVFMKKRKVYNTTEHRLPDDPALVEVRKKAAQAARKGEVGIGTAKEDAPKKTAWRMKSEAFRAAMRDAQIITKYQKEGKSLKDLPPPKATAAELDDRTPCPHCGRKFGEQQALRHIPVCAQKSKKQPNAAARQPAAAATAAARGPAASRQRRA